MKINERHVFLALEAFDYAPEGTELSELALESIFLYAEQKFDKPFTDRELAEVVQDMITGHGLEKATKLGYLETEFINGELHYSLTEDGNKMVEALGEPNKGE